MNEEEKVLFDSLSKDVLVKLVNDYMIYYKVSNEKRLTIVGFLTKHYELYADLTKKEGK